MAKRFTTATAEAATARRTAAGDGLYLQCSASGSKSWLVRTWVHGREVWAGIGPFGVSGGVTLAEAREECARMRKQARG